MTLSPQFLAQLQAATGNLEKQNPTLFPGRTIQPLGTINPATNALAQHLLTGGIGDFRGSYSPKPTQQGKSAISRILDVMSRPLYAAADAAYEAQHNASQQGESWSNPFAGFGDALKGLGTGVIHGLSGTEKRTWADVLQQGKDIHAQEKATGSPVNYTPGQGGPLSTGDKVAGVALNIIADPANAISPVGIARKAGISIPTVADLSRKAFSRGGDIASEAESAAAIPNAGTKPAPTIPAAPPSNPLLDVNPQALKNAKSIPDLLHTKIGSPVVVAAEHPHVNIDQEALANGNALKVTSLTDAGKTAAKGLHSMMGIGGSAQDAARAVANNALKEIGPGVKAGLERNRNWIAEAVKNGVDPQRAVQVVKDVQNGADFKTAFEDAVRNSKPFSTARKIARSGDLKGISDPHFKLSSILAPTAKEVLDSVHPQNPDAAANLAAIQQTKALNSIKRAGALSKPLNAAEQAIHDDVVQIAKNRIAGTNGFKPSGTYNDLAQSMVWNTVRGRLAGITHGGSANIRGINQRTLKVVAHIEDTLAGQGIKAVSGDGTPARITDAVLNHSEFPDKLSKYPNHILNHFVNGTTAGAIAKAQNAITEANAMKPVIQGAALKVNQLFQDPALSDPVKHLASQANAKGVEQSIGMLTGSTRAAKAGRQIYNAIVTNQHSAATDAMQSAGKALRGIVTTGAIPDNYKAIVDDLGKAVSRSLSDKIDIVPAPAHLGTLIGPEARAETGFLGRMATWYGQHDLRPIVRARQATARTNAALMGRALTHAFQGLTNEQRLEAVRIAQGTFIGAGNPTTMRAADEIRTFMENLLSSSKIPETARSGNTVAMRAGLTMEGRYGVNAELKRMSSQIKLTNGKTKDILGNEHDYSAGTNWLNSWQSHKFVGDPVKELARLNTAVWNAAAKKAAFDDIVSRFGRTGADAERNVGIKDLPFTKGVYFHPEIAQQIPRVVRDLYAPKPQQMALLRSMDNILRMWKTGVTIYSPSHAIHNGIGDIYNNWIAGVNDVRNYSKAIQVMRAFHANYKGLENLQPLFNSMQNLPGELSRFGATEGRKVIAQTADGTKLTAAQLYMAAHNQGILQSVEHMEDIYNDANGGLGGISRMQPFGGKVNAAAHAWVQGMDHFTRLAQFIHEVRNGRGDLTAIFDNAGRQVRKYHPDGMDLTDFERTVLRRVIPFYSWTRKAIPFSIEGMLAKPGKFLVYPLITSGLNIGNAANVNPGQQFPSDQLFPSWITDSGIGPVGGPGGILSHLTGDPTGYVTSSLSIPPIDLLQSYGNHPNQGILGGLNPLIKDPLELMQGQHLDTKVPITDPVGYAATEALPALGLAQRLTNIGTPKQATQGVGNTQNIANFLTGLKLTNTAQYVKEAKYELHQKQTQARSANRANLKTFLSNLNGG